MFRILVLTVAGILMTGCGGDADRLPGGIRLIPLPQLLETTLELDLEVTAAECLTLAMACGSIKLVAGDAAAPRLVARIAARGRTADECRTLIDRFRLQAERKALGLEVTYSGTPLEITEGALTNSLWPTVVFEITVPFGIRIDAETTAGAIDATGPIGSSRFLNLTGDVTVTRVTGNLNCSSTSGRVAVRDVNGEIVILGTEAGAIEAERVGGHLTAESSSGSIRARDVEGIVSAASTGNVTIDGRLTSVAVDSVTGAVEVTARPGSRMISKWSIQSRAGSVSLRVAEDFAFALEASSAAGTITCDWTLDDAERGKTGIRGSRNAAGHLVTLRSLAGNVHVGKLE